MKLIIDENLESEVFQSSKELKEESLLAENSRTSYTMEQEEKRFLRCG